MIHHRQVIRQNVIDRIKAMNIPGVMGRVGGRRFFPVQTDSFVQVADISESITPVSGEYERRLQIAVSVFVSMEDGADDKADSVCAMIEANLELDLGGLAQDGWLADVSVEGSGDGDRETLVKTMAYVLKYVTSYYNPTQATH